jgi:hypothetical protein
MQLLIARGACISVKNASGCGGFLIHPGSRHRCSQNYYLLKYTIHVCYADGLH